MRVRRANGFMTTNERRDYDEGKATHFADELSFGLSI